ncbi:acyltransferase family protein [Fluoribacter gormanii]|uniref:O-acetyltransferase OatA n=1 Tax=Fluoribacter gormanii TaxID=464 RepID=A0A377GFM6_9GAMM|nr:acyltransferase family protein [Fluoribacter gormanii]KTD04621.1 O-antigen acetylase [Fluoribacter gormanii]SIR33926.1 Peptidoglycan/LPS O-acetylase OafA/YrhL, contains acyltransferase and SGNH-hydrolase domains [Fluoribacter gormanii]STO23373.1 O-acetyltransferase OatA [Fluoribacter gormanii]
MRKYSFDYRADIDGLRAIAVLAIILFHLNANWLPGGFVGVDIFFVISGFLITRIIVQKLNDNSFSMRQFFWRRVQRILPATLCMIAMVMLVAYFIMLPQDLSRLSKTAITAVFSVTNIYYWYFLDTNYFADSSLLFPLLHLWSLGVEEQFYLIWPVLLMVAYKGLKPKYIKSILAVLALLSLCLSIEITPSHPLFAYYMLPTRAFELIIGGLAFLLAEYFNIRDNVRFINGIALLGFFLIIAAMFLLNENMAFPGWLVCIPTLGAATLLIANGISSNIISRLLSYKLLVSIGLISFSLYLWHWPILSFYRYVYVEFSSLDMVLCMVLILTTSMCSYFFVEERFRYSNGRTVTKLVQIACMFLVNLMPALWFIHQGGFLNKDAGRDYLIAMRQVLAQQAPSSTAPYTCQVDKYKKLLFSEQRCILGDATKQSKILMWGDSHSAHYVGFMKELAEHWGISITNFSHSQCLPFFTEVDKYLRHDVKDSCRIFNKHIAKLINDFDILIIAANWEMYGNRHKALEADLENFVRKLLDARKKVILTLDVPHFPKYDKVCKFKKLKVPSLDCNSQSEYEWNGETKWNRMVQAISRRYSNVYVLSINDLICRNQRCSAYLHGKALYFDKEHLSLYGSHTLGKYAIANNRIPLVLTDIIAQQKQDVAAL